MDIKINYTAYLVYDWEIILEKHLFHIKKSGLYDNCRNINIFAYPKNESILRVVEKYRMSDKTKISYQEENRYEFPAITDLIENPAEFNLYLHAKGVTKKNEVQFYVPSLSWNDYMTYFNVDMWRKVIPFLTGNASVGVEFGSSLTEPNKYHYSGNFWWSSKEHLNTIRNSQSYLEFLNSSNRYHCETIIGSEPGLFVELFNSGTNTPRTGYLYFNPISGYEFDQERIRKYLKK